MLYFDPYISPSNRELRVTSVTGAEVLMMNGRELVSLAAVGDGTYRTGEIVVTVGPEGERTVEVKPTFKCLHFYFRNGSRINVPNSAKVLCCIITDSCQTMKIDLQFYSLASQSLQFFARVDLTGFPSRQRAASQVSWYTWYPLHHHPNPECLLL